MTTSYFIKQSKMFHCKYCHQKFKYKSDLQSHLDQNHTKINKHNQEIDAKIKWKQILNGNTNNNGKHLMKKVKRKTNKNNTNKIENEMKCCTCHTYVIEKNNQCKSCISHCLGMPFCSNCDQRICFNDFKYWMNIHCKQDLNDKQVSDFNPDFLILCKCCYNFCKEFL